MVEVKQDKGVERKQETKEKELGKIDKGYWQAIDKYYFVEANKSMLVT